MSAWGSSDGRRFLDSPRFDPDAASSSVLAAGTRLVGDLRTPGDAVILGRIEGDVEAAGGLYLGGEGHVRGAVRARDACIEGTIEGPLEASGRVEVSPEGKISGGLRAARLDAAEGSSIQGDLVIQTTVNRFVEKRSADRET